MIVSASYRTDIPAFFADWFRAVLARGACEVANPYGGKPYRVDLTPPRDGGSASAFVFWTRNAAPFRAALADVAGNGQAFVVQFTVTGYPRLLDPHTPGADEAIAQIRELRGGFGARAVVWRYDPIVISSETPPDWHAANFASLAGRLAGAVDECVVSFAHIYRKTRRRLEAAAQTHGFTWRDPAADEKQALLAQLAETAGERGIRLTICSQPDITVSPDDAARCIDTARLSDVAGSDIAASQKGNRPGCLCAESRDIGAYDTCVHGCVYCYAVSDHQKAVDKLRGLQAVVST